MRDSQRGYFIWDNYEYVLNYSSIANLKNNYKRDIRHPKYKFRHPKHKFRHPEYRFRHSKYKFRHPKYEFKLVRVPVFLSSQIIKLVVFQYFSVHRSSHWFALQYFAVHRLSN